jgi:hypothetical protein
MVSVTPTCHKHSLAMRLVSARVRGQGDRDIFLYACPFPNCERRYLEEWNGYGMIAENHDYIPVAEWGQRSIQSGFVISSN